MGGGGGPDSRRGAVDGTGGARRGPPMLPKLLGALPAVAMLDGMLPGASVSRAGSCSCSDGDGARGRLLSRDGVAGTVTRSECADGRDKLSFVRATSGGICTAADGFELRGADL
jgi:hypothetical protein